MAPWRRGIAGARRARRSRPCWRTSSLHYALDVWLAREYPAVPFERYADDVILHCKSKPQAQLVLDAITARLAQVGLELNPDKTRIVYCKDAHRCGSHEHERFDFLGYTFRPRLARSRSGELFRQLLPGDRGRRRQGDRSHDQTLAAAPTQRTHPQRPRTSDQPDRAGLDQLLRPLLPVEADLASPTHRRLPRTVGHEEVQTAARAPATGTTDAGQRPRTRPAPLCPLASSAAYGRMTRAR